MNDLPVTVIEFIKRRDPDVVTRFYDFYFERVFSFAYSAAGDYDLALDIAQDVLLTFLYKVVNRIDFRLDGSFSAYLWGMVRKQFQHEFRKLSRFVEVVDDTGESLKEDIFFVDHSPSVERQVDIRMRLQEMSNLVEKRFGYGHNRHLVDFRK